MQFFSHAKDTEHGRIGTKLLSIHLRNVQAIFFLNLSSSLSLKISNDNDKLGDIVASHDIGKYTKYFQDYLLDRPNVDYSLKQHSLFGALYYLAKYFEEDNHLGLIGYWIISQHHVNLKSIMEVRSDFISSISETILEQLKKRQKTILQFADQVNNELNVTDIGSFQQRLRPFKEYFKAIKSIQKSPDIQNYFKINYLFSLLVEADKLDASDTPVYNRIPLPANKVDLDKGVHSQIWENGLENFEHLSLNQLRNLVRKRVIEKLSMENILDQKLFTLTGPTGIGKTLTALDFALKLREKIRKTEGYEAQIIYALPFINIIEQSESVYRKLFQNTDTKILSHYQYADAFQQNSKNDKTTGYDQKLMLLDTWQCDIVITTFVQFLQTLIGNRNKLLKKFNHYAGSIIILDEVQTIPLKQLPLVGASLYYLSKFLDSRVVLMTATKPKVFELANEKILNSEGEMAVPVELLGSTDDVAKIFKSFNRTKIKPLIEKPIKNQNEFIEGYLKPYWKADMSCLIVVNTVNLSIEVYQRLVDYFKEEKINNPVYYLSTNIIPAVRQTMIENIKLDIRQAVKAEGLKPVLISTQSIEAGVDLDFDMAFRDLAPIDSIIQVAGRVNRENDKRFIGTIFLIDFGKCGSIYGPMTENTVRNAIQHFTMHKKTIYEKDYLSLVTYYYDNIYERNNDGFSFSQNFFKSMKELNYDGNDWSVSKYQLIGDGFKACSVFIECDESAQQALVAFKKMINKEISHEKFEPYKRTFHQHIIAVPDYLPKFQEIKQMNTWMLSENLWYVPHEVVHDYYDDKTGFIRQAEKEELVRML